MGFNSIRSLVDSEIDSGRFHKTMIRKTTPASTTGWVDLSSGAGNPPANFYASEPLVAATLLSRKGIYHGEAVAPMTKHLSKLTLLSSAALVPLTLVLCDYLLYYPFVDMDSTDTQEFDNTVTLPRYSDGSGVQAFLVAQGSYTGGAQFSINYTNSEGVAGRVSPTITSNTLGLTANLISTGPNPNTSGWNIPLQSGDTGIRSVQSITFASSNGGISALVLCKPLATMTLRENTAAVERDFFIDFPSMPRIQDGAYLNFLALPALNINNATFIGLADFVWG